MQILIPLTEKNRKLTKIFEQFSISLSAHDRTRR